MSAETPSVGDDMIRSIFERWQRLEEEKQTISDDLKELFAEAKGNGFDTKALRAVFRDMTKDRAEADEFDAIYDLYWSSLNKPRAHPAHAHIETLNNFPPHDADTGELTEEQESIPSADRANPEHVDVDRSAERASSAVEIGATNSPERARSMSMTPIEPREANGLKGFGFTVTFEDPAPPPSKAAGQTGDRVTPPTLSPVAIPEDVPTFLIKKPVLRPHCLNPGENCGGQGVRHCYSCVKAMAESGVAA